MDKNTPSAAVEISTQISWKSDQNWWTAPGELFKPQYDLPLTPFTDFTVSIFWFYWAPTVP